MAQGLGNVAVGSTVKLKENGVPQDYLVVHQGLPSSMYDASCNGTWILRQDIIEELKWDFGNSNVLENSDIQAWLNGTMLDKYDADIQSAIKTVKIPYRLNGGEGGPNQTVISNLECKIFILSACEVGYCDHYNYMANDGSKLSYFLDGIIGDEENKRRIAKFNGEDTEWWLRSPYVTSTNSGNRAVWFVEMSGQGDAAPASYSKGVRPAMVLPFDLIVDDDGNILPIEYPDPPASITVPTSSVPTGGSIPISWSSASGSTYKLQRSVDGGVWTDLWTGSGTSYTDTAGVWTRVKYRVASVKSGITSGYTESREVFVILYTVAKITAPSQVMTGQTIPVSWSTVAAATTYVLERKSSSADWAQIYSGADTQFTDTPEGGWTSVQYRVKAGKDGTFGGYTTSPEIPVISASALVISGQDGDLGTLTENVPYTVSSDSGNPITVERFVNGNLVTRVTVESGSAYSIPVMELPTGAGTIKLVCSVTPSVGGPVTATRIWGYTKAVVRFPEEGGPALLQQEGKNVLTVTLAECIKVPTNWGGSLDKSLELLLPLLNTAVMATGSYTGTGTFGQDNPNELSFTFDPEIVIVSGASGSITISNKEPSGGQSDGYIQNQKATWYSTSAAKQLNVQGEQYSYWAVGKAVQT